VECEGDEPGQFMVPAPRFAVVLRPKRVDTLQNAPDLARGQRPEGFVALPGFKPDIEPAFYQVLRGGFLAFPAALD
jgi:hypothetical protein